MKTAIIPSRQDLNSPSSKTDSVEEAYIKMAVATVGNGLHEELAAPLRRNVRERLEEQLPLSGEHMLNIILTAKREVTSGRMPAELYQKHEDAILKALRKQ